MTEIIIVVFLSLTILLVSFLSVFRNRYNSEEKQIQRRLENMQTGTKEKSNDLSFIIRDDDLSEIPFVNRFLQKLQISDNLSILLEQAGVRLKVGQLMLIMVLCAASGFR